MRIIKFLSLLCLGLVCLGGITGIFSGPALLDAQPVLSKNKIKLSGSVDISCRPRGDTLSVNIYLHRMGELLSGQKVTVQGVNVPEKTKGYYFKFIKPFQGGTVNTIRMTVDPMKKFPDTPMTASLIKGSASSSKRIRILQPAPETSVQTGPRGSVVVKWIPTAGTVKCRVVELIGNTGGDIVFNQMVSGGRVSIPVSILLPGKRYGIYISRKMADFTFTGPAHPSSSLALRQSDATYIRTL